LTEFIESLENSIGIKAKQNLMPMQPGDVYQTYADVDDLFNTTGYKPAMSVSQGVDNFVNWYRDFYQI
jgi:UDP-glucuronate 4-epimerase